MTATWTSDADLGHPPADLRLIIGPGTTARLPELLTARRRVALFCTERALRESGVRALLAGHDVAVFTAITPNPTVSTVLPAAELVAQTRPAVVVAIGGGSTLDVAKCARSLPPDRDTVLAALAGDRDALRDPRPDLVLLPTTAGSGSEVTRFATVYDDGRKYSLDFPEVRADIAIVDPDRTATCPPSVTWPTAFDALAHAVESLWSKRSTPESTALATAALAELVELTARPVDTPGSDRRHRLAVAATTAGRAIDLTRTTAAHAFSYWQTSNHGVPHGTACALNLVWLMRYNAAHATPSEATRLAEVHRLLGGPDAVAERLARAGVSTRLRDHGVTDVEAFVDAGLGNPSRADNNPVALHRDAVLEEVVRHY